MTNQSLPRSDGSKRLSAKPEAWAALGRGATKPRQGVWAYHRVGVYEPQNLTLRQLGATIPGVGRTAAAACQPHDHIGVAGSKLWGTVAAGIVDDDDFVSIAIQLTAQDRCEYASERRGAIAHRDNN